MIPFQSFFSVQILSRQVGDNHEPMFFDRFETVQRSVALTCSTVKDPKDKLHIVPSHANVWKLVDGHGKVHGKVRKIEDGQIHTTPEHL